MYPTDNQRACANGLGTWHTAQRGQPLLPGTGLACAIALVAVVASCDGADDTRSDIANRADASARPNVLFVVWDTVRADRMSLYGHKRETTPALERWAENALVFDDVISTAGYTVPSHGSMFTGRLPSEHCASGDNPFLDEANITLAELMRDAGYATFLYSENPHLSEASKFAQGFERIEHPWSPQHIGRALEILQAKVKGDTSSELGKRVAEMGSARKGLTAWNVKAAGELAESAVANFLASKDSGKPFFAFVNYMEAHRPFIPPRRFRKKFMSDADVEASYRVDRSWNSLWEFTFRHSEFSERDLELTRATYDASLLELDELFDSLLSSLEASGQLRNTIVVVTADHGEHLGEQHMFDHQASLYESVLRVPLILYHPTLVRPGRRSDPAMNFDVFSSLLALTGVAPPEGVAISSRNLLALNLSPEEGARDAASVRIRLAQETTAESTGVRAMRGLHPGWDPTPWVRTQRAVYSGRYKWIESSPGEPELYDLRADPGEQRNLANLRAIDAATMRDALTAAEAKLVEKCATRENVDVSPEDHELLKALGYVPGDE